MTCVLDSSISSDDVQWNMDTSAENRVNQQEGYMIIVPFYSENSFTTSLYIFNAIQSYTGYYWIRLPSGDVCNVSLTVTTSMYIATVCIWINPLVCTYIYSIL